MTHLGHILVHLDGGPHNAARLAAARELAARHDATVTALYAVMPSFIEVPFALEAAGAALDALKALDDERLAKAKALVDALNGGAGAHIHWAVTDRSVPTAAFTQQAFYADLLVLGQREPVAHTSGVPPDFIESVVLASGRPALVLPHAGAPAAIGRSVLVAWKESAQSVHALTAALPILQRAERVDVVTWGGEADLTPGASDIGSYLGRHGVQIERHHWADEPSITGELILSTAADRSADLVVMGCYGHSRARELVLGGATRTILGSMTVPVLMAH
jgi:nucleotide-binding universal stress UspA family protein